MYDFDDILTPKNTHSGMADHFYYAPIFGFSNIKGPIKSPIKGSANIVSESHQFGAGKGFIKIQTAPFFNNLNFSSPEPGVGNQEQKLTVFVNGNYPELHEFVENAMHTPCLVLIPECSGYYWQLGNAHNFVWMSCEGGTGTTKDGRKGYTLTFHYAYKGMWLYKGIIKMKSSSMASALLYGPDSGNELLINNSGDILIFSNNG